MQGPRKTALALWLALPLVLGAQALQVSPKAVKLTQVEGGPLAIGKLTLRSSGAQPQPWTVSATPENPNEPWLTLSAASGTTPATLTLGIVDWRGEAKKPGTFRHSLTIKSGAAVVTVPVEWEVRPGNPAPKYSYLAGPAGCAESKGYADPPLCTPLPIPGIVGPPQPGDSYVDPNFGGRVRVLTGAQIFHTYATPSPLSAHAKYLMTWPENGTWDVVDVATTRIVYRRVPANQSYFWDAGDDEVYYYIQDATIIRHDLRTNRNAVLIDYAKQPEQFHSIVRGGTGDTSKDNWISFWAPDDKYVCAIDLSHVKTYCADYADSQRKLPYGNIDFTLISKGVDRTSGKRYVMVVAPPAMGIFSVDETAGVLKPEFRGPESPEKPGNNDGVCDPGERCHVGSHLDTLEDSNGIQYLVEDRESTTPCEVSVSSYQLNTGINLLKQVELGGGRRKVMTLWRCGRGWVDEHVGCAKAAPYCVISTQAEGRNANDSSEPTPTPHANELIVIKENGTEIRRLALTRTVYYNGTDNYFAAPRAALSSDGSVVIFDSNFGQRGKPRIVLVETGYGKP
ncbi:MAG: hypothetical protein ABI759_20645 [Candidatus Solibacter sp.]